MTTQCFHFEITHPECDREEFIRKLKLVAKKWVFQLEEGDSGYRHFQGRISLFKKRRKGELLKVLAAAELSQLHVSETSNNALSDATFYFLKFDTKIDGPWSDQDTMLYVPRQYRDLELYGYQQSIIRDAEVFNSRTVNYIYDPAGCNGKSTIAAICCLHHRGIRIPAVNDHEKLLASVCDILTAKEERHPGPIFIDLPRYMDKKRLHGIFAAIEEIKNGHAYDMRYHFKEWWFDSPPVWVFANVPPDLSALSSDRWKIWKINGIKWLQPMTEDFTDQFGEE